MEQEIIDVKKAKDFSDLTNARWEEKESEIRCSFDSSLWLKAAFFLLYALTMVPAHILSKILRS